MQLEIIKVLLIIAIVLILSLMVTNVITFFLARWRKRAEYDQEVEEFRLEADEFVAFVQKWYDVVCSDHEEIKKIQDIPDNHSTKGLELLVMLERMQSILKFLPQLVESSIQNLEFPNQSDKEKLEEYLVKLKEIKTTFDKIIKEFQHE